jgi:predicted enzyme related to lactoylglutathione lyase
MAAAPRGSWWDGSAASTPPPEPEVGVTAPFLLSRSASARTGHVERHATRKEYPMTEGIKTIIIPVRDLAAAKALYGTALDVEPYADEPYYVGFRVGDQEIGLDPNGHNHGMTGPVGYCHVDDVAASLRQAVDAGWRTQQDVKDVGGGGLAATVEDPDGNVVGFLQR